MFELFTTVLKLKHKVYSFKQRKREKRKYEDGNKNKNTDSKLAAGDR